MRENKDIAWSGSMCIAELLCLGAIMNSINLPIICFWVSQGACISQDLHWSKWVIIIHNLSTSFKDKCKSICVMGV